MYNYGLIRFLEAKSVGTKKAVTAFLASENITSFTYKNHNRVNDYIQNNWVKFSSFIDRSIKNGSLQGHAIKLNNYFDEQRERHEEIRQEFELLNLSKDELKIINRKSYEWGAVHSFLAKKGFNTPAKDYDYTSKKLQFMPTILLMREHNLIEEFLQLTNQKL